jgi:hypothetical protein
MLAVAGLSSLLSEKESISFTSDQGFMGIIGS